MNLHDVNIKVPSAEEQSNTIVVTGAPANVENAKADLHDRVKDLEAEKADKELKSFDIQLDIKPEYHPKIIGRKGAVITKLRMDYRVNIQLPKKDDPEASIITITGYEKDANEAKIAIQKIVGDFVSVFYLCLLNSYILRRTQSFAKSSPYLFCGLHQNIWTLYKTVLLCNEISSWLFTKFDDFMV